MPCPLVYSMLLYYAPTLGVEGNYSKSIANQYSISIQFNSLLALQRRFYSTRGIVSFSPMSCVQVRCHLSYKADSIGEQALQQESKSTETSSCGTREDDILIGCAVTCA